MNFQAVPNLLPTKMKQENFSNKKSRGKAMTKNPSPTISVLNYHLKTQLALCNSLEEIADGLPDNIDNQECLHIARSIYATVKRAHDFEENVVFPLLTRNGDDHITATIDRLHGEHWEDESFAQELQDALIKFVADRQHGNAETLSYMLRGFFEGIRRHIAFEKEFVAPLIQKAESRGDA